MYWSTCSHASSDSPKAHRTSGPLFTLIVALLFASPLHARNLPTHHLRADVGSGKAKSLGRLPSSQTMQLDVVLPLKDRPGLQSFLQQLYDPSSPSYRHFLSVQEFTEKFGPSQDDYDAVVKFAKANGFKVVGGSRGGSDVQLKGPVATVEKALHVNMGVYQHPAENRTYYAPDREPTLDLQVPLWHISGLDNYSIPHPLVKQKTQTTQTSSSSTGASASSTSARSLVTTSSSTNSVPNATTGSCPNASFCGSDMRAAYYGGTLTGTGQSIGLVEFYGYDISDLDTYYANTGQTRTAKVTGISADGTSLACSRANFCDDTEQILDMTQALGMAPGLDTLYVFVGSTDTAILSAMVTATPRPLQLSCSWAWLPADPATDDPYFEQMAAQGQSFFTAAGDWSSWYAGLYVYPADDANVTSVGGTSLSTTNAGSTWASEIGWDYSGGGISPDGIPIPYWQQAAGVITSQNKGSTVYRNGPDVAANSDFSFYVCAAQTTCTTNMYGGTSFAAPMWAAYIALANQQAAALGQPPVGFINPALYAIGISGRYQNDFHDIIGGNNGFLAGIGFDLETGWGSPNGENLINDLTPANPTFFLASPVIPAALSVPQGGSGSVTVNTYPIGGFNSNIALSVSSQPAGVSLSFGPISIAAPGSGSAVLNVQVASTAALGVYNLTITGTGGGTTQTIMVALTVNGPATHLVLSAPAKASYNAPFSFDVIAQDALNHTSTGYTGTVRFTSSDPQATLPGNAILTNGTGTFSATLYTRDVQTLTVADTTSGTITSATANIVVGVPTKFSVMLPAYVGTTYEFKYYVTALDQYGAVAPGYTGKVHFSSSDPLAVLPANVVVNGMGAFTASMDTGGAQSITATDTSNASMTGSGSTTVQKITAKPTFTPAPVVYFNTPQSIVLGDSTSGANIYYTTDGSTPTASSTLYTGPIAVNTTTTIQVMAVASGYDPSEIASATYVLMAATPTIFPAPVMNFTSPQSVTLSDVTPGVSFYYTRDGSTPTAASTLYTGPIGVNSTTTINAIAMGNGFQPSSVAAATYTIVAPPPSFTPGATGTFSSPVSVKLTDLAAGVPIYYTTDGTTPTTGSHLYTGALTVSATTTIKAIAAGNGYDPGAVASATYTFAAAAPSFTPGAVGTFNTPVSLKLTDISPGVSIYYTTDGTAPTTESTLYTGAIALKATTTVKAIASGNGYAASQVSAAAYTFVAASPSFTPGAAYPFSTPVSVSLSDMSPGVSVYYTKDGSTPTTSSTLYTGAFTVSSNMTIKAIAVGSGYGTSAVATANYTFVAAAPSFTPGAVGSFNSPVSVKLTDLSPGVSIYYTTDGTAPTTASTLYTGAFTLNATTTLKAIATGNGYGTSSVATTTYTFVAARPTFAPGTYGSFNSHISVSLSDVSPGASIYYTKDGSTPTTSSTLYTGSIALNATTTIKAIAVANGYGASPVASATYTFVAATPTFSAYPGTYNTQVSLNLSDVSPGVPIYYTTDGSTPTTSSTPCSGAVTISATATIKAIASGNGYGTSPVASATYTISH